MAVDLERPTKPTQSEKQTETEKTPVKAQIDPKTPDHMKNSVRRIHTKNCNEKCQDSTTGGK